MYKIATLNRYEPHLSLSFQGHTLITLSGGRVNIYNKMRDSLLIAFVNLFYTVTPSKTGCQAIILTKLLLINNKNDFTSNELKLV
jgi:hypothetical protein